MSDTDMTKYFNYMLARMEQLLYHELSGTAHKKVEMVGVDFLQSKDVRGNSIDEVIDSCKKEIIATGLAKQMRHSIHGDGILLRFEVNGCIHISKEAKLKKEGFEPYMCPLANMIGDRIIELLNYEIGQLANIAIDEKTQMCVVKYAVFENLQKVGQVSDWLNI